MNRIDRLTPIMYYLETQHYKVWIKGKEELSRERSSALPYTSVL